MPCLTLSCAAEGTPVQPRGFHHERLSATQGTGRARINVVVRQPVNDEEVWAAAWLRAKSFHAYPAGREFAGQIHQRNKAQEAYDALAQLQRRAKGPVRPSKTCLVALAAQDAEKGAQVLGTLDLVAAGALDDQVLRGKGHKPGYLDAVCVDVSARRQGVGAELIAAARSLAQHIGFSTLYVHTLAANEAARAFYERHGFTVEQMESSNRAHYRGQCLDGISGAARTVLLRDQLL